MSESHNADAKRLPLDPPADTLSPEAMAVVDAFAEACARGEAPSLSVWLRRYPAHAALLADYAAAFAAEQAATVEDADAERELSPGTLRALDTIMGGMFAGPSRDSLLRVAESPASYDAAKEREDDVQAEGDVQAEDRDKDV